MISAIIISFSGLIIRNIENANSWTIIFYRALAFTLAIFCFILFKNRSNFIKKFNDVGIAGILVGIILGFTNITYIIAITNTTVANTLFTISLIPLLTTLLAFIFLKEKISISTFFSIVLAFLGIVIMFAGSVISGYFFGNFMALITAILFSISTVIIRLKSSIEMLPSLVLGGIFSIFLTLIVTQFSLYASYFDIFLCFLLGGLLSAFANASFVLATRYIPAAEVTFYLFIEFALGPFWVWIFVNEEPAGSTLLGGFIILFSLLTKTSVDYFKAKRSL